MNLSNLLTGFFSKYERKKHFCNDYGCFDVQKNKVFTFVFWEIK